MDRESEWTISFCRAETLVSSETSEGYWIVGVLDRGLHVYVMQCLPVNDGGNDYGGK